jgi:HAD superfamily hydrolase (TIGR01509 family)
MKLEALIFDVDGTLAETEELHRQSFNLTFQQFKLDWDWDPELYAKLLQTTGGKERMIRYVHDYVPEQSAVLDQLPLMHKMKTRSYLDLLSRGALKLRPGVERLVYEAQDRGLKLAIATTSTPTNVRALLRSTLGEDSANWFAITAGDIVMRKKPSPDVYFEALEALDVGPGHAIAFEDSTNGTRAALESGVNVVATPSLYLAEEDFSGALSVVSNLGEPDKPFTYLAGATFPHSYVDVDGLALLLEEHDAGRVSAV